MSEQQQPKEYIITETQLMHLLNELPCQFEPIVAKEIRSRPHPAPAPTFSEEECEYLEELILDNIEQYPDSGSFTPEKRDALYQKIAFKMQAGDGDE